MPDQSEPGKQSAKKAPTTGTSQTGTRAELRSDRVEDDGGERWAARPGLARALRWAVAGSPVVAGVVACLAFDKVVARPHGAAVAWWLIGSLVCASVAAAAVERVARRLLPLAGLLRMTLLFPDQAPSRYKIARTAANPARLAELAADAPNERSAAAAEVLALLGQLSRHDRATRGHSERVRVFSDLLAEQLDITGLDRDKLRWGALLHDIGKISVPAEILNSKTRPTPEEWSIIQGHPEAGEALAGPLFGWLGEWSGAITEHHERYDGKGYPLGLAASELSLAGRMVAITDAYETMTAARSYKKPMATAAARKELVDCAGKQFDPELVRAFLLISLGRVSRSVGLLSWVMHLPFASRLQSIGSQLAATASSATAPVAALGVGTFAAAAVTVSGVAPVSALAAQTTPGVVHASHTSHQGGPAGHGSAPRAGGVRSSSATAVPTGGNSSPQVPAPAPSRAAAPFSAPELIAGAARTAVTRVPDAPAATTGAAGPGGAPAGPAPVATGAAAPAPSAGDASAARSAPVRPIPVDPTTAAPAPPRPTPPRPTPPRPTPPVPVPPTAGGSVTATLGPIHITITLPSPPVVTVPPVLTAVDPGKKKAPKPPKPPKSPKLVEAAPVIPVAPAPSFAQRPVRPSRGRWNGPHEHGR